MKTTFARISIIIGLSAATAGAQMTQIRAAAPAAALAAAPAAAMPAFAVPTLAVSAAPAALAVVPMISVAPAAAPIAQTALQAGAANVSAAGKSAAGPSVSAALNAFFDNAAAPADGPHIPADAFPSEIGYREPSVHAEIARAATGAADAQLIAAGAHLQNKSQIWSYTFYSPNERGFTKVAVDFLGKATIQDRFPARGIDVSAPIDLSRTVTLARAYQAARRAGFYPATVSLERDLQGRAHYRFDGLGDQQILVDAETGALISRPH